MKPAPFKYYAPTTVEEALLRLAEYGDEAKVLAGGQSLIPAMNFRLARPAVIVDLNRVSELFYIRPQPPDALRIGAMTRQREVERSPLVVDHAPLVGEAMPFIAHPQIRNRGTVGGSIAHADPAAELPAVMIALEARFRLANQRRNRWIPAAEFFTGLFGSALEPEELLVEISLPPSPPRTGWAFCEIARRHGDYALAGVAAVLTLDESGRCRQARIAFLSLGDGPVQADETSRLLQGQVLAPEVLRQAGEMAATREIDPPGDIHASSAYRRHLCRVLTVRALTRASQRAQGAIQP
ncbi:MAG: FAD binding domain-containing protein [Acidobacteriota bacterium]